MALLRRMYARLHLRVNEAKSAVGSVFGRKFLGYSLWAAPKGGRRQTQGGSQADGNVQAADQTTEPTLGRTKPARCGAASATVHDGLEGLLWAGANTGSLAYAGRMAASPTAGHTAQAMEAGYDYVPRTASAGGAAVGGAACANKKWRAPSPGAASRPPSIPWSIRTMRNDPTSCRLLRNKHSPRALIGKLWRGD